MSIYTGHSHSFDIGIANELGVNAAVVFNHIVYWLRINAAKGNNIHDGKVWTYETQGDIAKCLDYLTLEEVKKAVVKLLDSGILIKGNYNKNSFDKTAWYTTADQSIFQKTLSKAPYGAIGSAEKRDRERPTAPCIYKEQEEHIQKEQQQQTGAAAVFSAQKGKEEQKTKIYPVLGPIDIPIHDKEEITRDYSKEDVIHAVKYALSLPQEKIRTCLAAAIKWACKVKPEIVESKETIAQRNRTYAMKYDEHKSGDILIEALNKNVEVKSLTSNYYRSLPYTDKDFMKKFKELLEKNKFRILEE